MLREAFEMLGGRVTLFSPDGTQTGTPLGRISLIKTKARERYREDVRLPGHVTDALFVYVGSCDDGGDTLVRDSTLAFEGKRYLVLRCDRVQVADVAVMWAVVQQIPWEVAA